MKTEKQTLGEKRIRVSFNASGSLAVDNVKRETASIIDTLDAIKNNEVSKTYEEGEETLKLQSGEKLRLIAIAQTKYEEAAMWATKALTI